LSSCAVMFRALSCLLGLGVMDGTHTEINLKNLKNEMSHL